MTTAEGALDKNAKHDPLAGDFIRAQLGEHKWRIFSSRLAEQRASKHKLRLASADDVNAAGASADAATHHPGCVGRSTGGASVLDFLVKVEVVKSVLRTYVP